MSAANGRHHRADVVSEALRVLDAYGLADLTMRRLATELGVQPSALYHHFGNKQLLLAAVADELLARGHAVRGPVPEPADWAARVTALCSGLRDSMLAYRDGAELVATVHAYGLGATVPEREIARELRSAGLEPEVAAVATRALLHYVFGHVADEQTHLQASVAGAIEDAPRASSDFELGLDLVIAGTRSRLADTVPQDRLTLAERSSVVGGEQARAARMLSPGQLGQAPLGARDRLVNEVDIVRSLLDDGGITIAMQPIVLLSNLAISGWEALLRGEHPQLGSIPPVVLVEVAQQAGLLDELTKQVAELALTATAEAAEIAGEPLRITVNVELEQLYANGPFVEWLLEREIPENVLLTVEVTERGGDEWTAANEHVAELLAARGIDIGLDDVGAGHSRIGFFRHRKWDLAKIDQSFLSWGTERDRAVIELFVHMIHGLGLASLAEGIETAEHLVFAQSLGIRFGQGYWLGRPATVAATLENLRRNGLAIEASF